ncbi:MAG: SIMPL domain-containing protein [Candidatus Thiodiazotropha sp.]|jgi:predicted secreted protein
MRLILSGFTLLFACLLPASSPYAAEQPPRYDQVNLSAVASQETDNDTLIAVLSTQKEGSDPAALSDSVNRLIEQALLQAKQQPEIKVQTLGYQTSPIYRQQRLSGWRVKQSLRLESRDSDRLSQLLSSLQGTLALESISYAVSDERRRAVEEALIKQALEAFQQRAKLITHQLGRQSYRLVEMSIRNSDQPVSRMPMRASMMTMEGAVATPQLEAGSQTLRVEINGRIELQLN